MFSSDGHHPSFPLLHKCCSTHEEVQVFPVLESGWPWDLLWPGECSERTLWDCRAKAFRELMASASTLLEAIHHRRKPISWGHNTEETTLAMGRGCTERATLSWVPAGQLSQVKQQTCDWRSRFKPSHHRRQRMNQKTHTNETSPHCKNDEKE